MCDHAGDSLRGRWTVPLAIGDGPSRITIAIPMAFWSWFGPWFWALQIPAYIVPLGLGLTVALRTLVLRRAVDEARTFQIWNFWIVVFYFLPLLAKRKKRLAARNLLIVAEVNVNAVQRLRTTCALR